MRAELGSTERERGRPGLTGTGLWGLSLAVLRGSGTRPARGAAPAWPGARSVGLPGEAAEVLRGGMDPPPSKSCSFTKGSLNVEFPHRERKNAFCGLILISIL